MRRKKTRWRSKLHKRKEPITVHGATWKDDIPTIYDYDSFLSVHSVGYHVFHIAQRHLPVQCAMCGLPIVRSNISVIDCKAQRIIPLHPKCSIGQMISRLRTHVIIKGVPVRLNARESLRSLSE